MNAATFLGAFLIFLLAGAALSVGQWFGRAPIEGRCRPRGGTACGSPDCCRVDRESEAR
jgi:hypothetical protein